MIDFQQFEADYAAQRQRQEQANMRNLAAIMDALAGLGIATLEVTFDGCGDSGQIEEVTAEGGTGSLEGVEVAVESARLCADSVTQTFALQEAVEHLCYGLLEVEYDGWENNDGAFGAFTFDIAKREILLEFNGRYSSYETSLHSYPVED